MKLKIKDILQLNKNTGYIPTENEINKIYNILVKINRNGSNNLSQEDIQELYQLFALNITYATSEERTIKRNEKIKNITKNGNITIDISDVFYSSRTSLSFLINVRKDLELEENTYIEVIKDIFSENLFSGFFYKTENSTYPNVTLDTLYSNNIPVSFLPWSSNNSNNVVNETNNNYKIKIIKKQINFYQIEVSIDILNCNNLYNFLILHHHNCN